MFVGDRGMITQAHAATFKEQGVDFISALKSVQIRSLVNSGELQLSLFDEVNLAEITSTAFPGERLVVCRNPAVAAERARKRAELLAATEAELDKVKAMVTGPRGTPARRRRRHDRPARRACGQQVQGRQALHAADRRRPFAYERNSEQITNEAALDGLYVIRTTLPADRLGAPAAVRAYKQLKLAEHAFKTMKDTIEIRPIHHHLDDRVRAHVFLCMLAYYVAYELEATPHAAAVHRRHPARTDRPRQARHPLTLSPRESRQRPHRRPVPRPHPPRPARRPRHHLPQPDPHPPPASTPSRASPHPPRYEVLMSQR